jgi:hypothetical protein
MCGMVHILDVVPRRRAVGADWRLAAWKRWGIIPFLVLWRPIGTSGRLESDGKWIEWVRREIWVCLLAMHVGLGPGVGRRGRGWTDGLVVRCRQSTSTIRNNRRR